MPRLHRDDIGPSKRSSEKVCTRRGADLGMIDHPRVFDGFLRKEVIQPQVPLRLPCYDFTPVTDQTFGDSFLAVRSSTSGPANSHGVTGGVYKARERIHRGVLIRDY